MTTTIRLRKWATCDYSIQADAMGARMGTHGDGRKEWAMIANMNAFLITPLLCLLVTSRHVQIKSVLFSSSTTGRTCRKRGRTHTVRLWVLEAGKIPLRIPAWTCLWRQATASTRLRRICLARLDVIKTMGWALGNTVCMFSRARLSTEFDYGRLSSASSCSYCCGCLARTTARVARKYSTGLLD